MALFNKEYKVKELDTLTQLIERCFLLNFYQITKTVYKGCISKTRKDD